MEAKELAQNYKMYAQMERNFKENALISKGEIIAKKNDCFQKIVAHLAKIMNICEGDAAYVFVMKRDNILNDMIKWAGEI